MHASGIFCSPAFVDGVCVCERERDRQTDRDRETEGQRLTWEALAWKTPKVSKTREVLVFNMLASTSLEAPGQDLLCNCLSNFRNVAWAGLFPYHEPLQSLWRQSLLPYIKQNSQTCLRISPWWNSTGEVCSLFAKFILYKITSPNWHKINVTS